MHTLYYCIVYLINFHAAESLPNKPVITDISVTATTATISYLITAIAYTPERYRVEYVGLELQSHLNVTSFVYSSTDITVTNISHTVTLTDLEEANTYEFVIKAGNCLGNTTTEVMNFTTFSTCKYLISIFLIHIYTM